MGGQPIATHSQQTFSRFQMHIITTPQRLLALSIDISTQMIFIGTFIFAEARVAIKTIARIFHRHMCHLGIKLCDGCDSLFNAMFEICPTRIILILMFLKPLAIVVGSERTKIIQYSFCVHIIL